MKTKEILKKLREERGYNIQDVAKKIGMQYTMCREYESGDRNLGMSAAIKFADFYGVTIDYLLGREDPPNNPILSAKQKEKIALEKWLNLDDEKRKAVLIVMESIIKAYELSENQPKKKPDIRLTIPIKKSRYRTSAGIGYDLNDADAWERVNVMDCPAARRADFIIEIDGDSMEPDFHSGNNVFVKATPDVEIGEIGIFIVDGKGYIKELGDGYLISHNGKYEPIPLKDTENQCIGKVLGVAELVEDE